MKVKDDRTPSINTMEAIIDDVVKTKTGQSLKNRSFDNQGITNSYLK